jgi:hypothetical protein
MYAGNAAGSCEWNLGMRSETDMWRRQTKTSQPGMHGMWIGAILLGLCTASPSSGQEYCFISDRNAGIVLQHQQDWGDFGFDTATSAVGGVGSPLRIGDTTYEHGLGHHANGEIVIELGGQFERFRSWVGVHWQGGGRGSVTFQVLVDGEIKFEAGPMSDSDSAQQVEVPLHGARELRLVATDSGDGISCDMANWADASLLRDRHVPFFGPAAFDLPGEAKPIVSAPANGFVLVGRATGPQFAVMAPAGMVLACVDGAEELSWSIPVMRCEEEVQFSVDAEIVGPGPAKVELAAASSVSDSVLRGGERITLTLGPLRLGEPTLLTLKTLGTGLETAVRWGNLRYKQGDVENTVFWNVPSEPEKFPPPKLPALRSPVEQMLVEWDWRMQDGIGTDREPRSWRQAAELVLQRGDQLIQKLRSMGIQDEKRFHRWEQVRDEVARNSKAESSDPRAFERTWRRIHQLRREIALANPLADVGPLVFVKRVPAGFSHQLTQYGGRRARPGGGVFVLNSPGQSMACRELTDLPPGSYMHPAVSWDGKKILFAYCQTKTDVENWVSNPGQYYHLYEVTPNGEQIRQLTDGPYDDFAPCFLPNGKIMFVSTRRGGFHRCGRGPCPVYTLTVADADGSNIRVVSFHETHEWDPAVLNDGRIVYTRWDYVDRHAVHYQQLWTVRQDGSDVRAFYGNNTLNPVGVWEARPVPGSTRVMATAAAHHAMTAGSIILLDISKGMDGLAPITRLTPDALFPESEFAVERWHATAGVPDPPDVPVEERRWPGHCYRTPYPLSEDFFLAAYSFDSLLGEPFANKPNMFGIYLVDRFGNKELLYRDANVGSLWPIPLRARPAPPALPTVSEQVRSDSGVFWLQDVHASWPELRAADGVVKSLRIIQVLPKTTPHANTPRVGRANASPGKQVLGTVPVEEDGSAYFRAPAGIPLAFQALDERGMAIQTMRSLTYLQPGEHVGCVGCHEHRTTTSNLGGMTLASHRAPSDITPAPDGAKPFSYPILVQPILDQHCVSCHGGDKCEGDIDLTGVPEGEFSRSYNALISMVAFSEWKGTPQANFEPMTHPNQFGARGSRLTELLLSNHEGVSLSDQEMERLVTWMDTNALFFGTFMPEDQQRQLRGERIAGPALE